MAQFHAAPRRKQGVAGLLVIVLCSMLVACGGGGGSGNTVASRTTISQDSTSSDSNKTPRQNPVQQENAKVAGVTDAWQIAGQDIASQHEIEGYASATSVNRGETIRFYVSTIDPSYTISIYRLGWYGGHGGRLLKGPISRTGFKQAAPTIDPDTHMVECDWTDPYLLSIPSNPDDPTDWASGIYVAKLTGSSSGKQSYILFAVRDDARRSDLLYQSSATTLEAYNNWGGYSLYPFNSAGGQPAYKVSFNRPYGGTGAAEFFGWEIYMLRFLEREGFDVSYSTNIDTHRAPGQVLNHRAFLSTGHDEYWTKEMRDALDAARDNGVNLGFFGSNTGYWQIRLEPSPRSQDPDRTVVGYKYAAKDFDPMYKTAPKLTTYLWREPFDPPINRPEAALVGVMYDYDPVGVDTPADIVIADCSSWICAGTGLQTGSVLKGMLGYEVDSIAPSSPQGIAVIGKSPYKVCLDDSCSKSEIRYSNMTYYTAASGAGVFATGSMYWHWGLDDFGNTKRVNPAVQQITRNVLKHFVGQ